MPSPPLRPCTTPGCPQRSAAGRCDRCRTRNDRARGSAAQRGYDRRWSVVRTAYLLAHPRCALCRQLATVADHHPVSRRTLVAQRCPDPDAEHRLRPLCRPCHAMETARLQPGGWNVPNT